MASSTVTDKKGPRKGDAAASRTNGDSARWIFGLTLLFAGIFLVAAVVFYYFDWKADYSVLSGAGAENPAFDDTIENPCGRLGARAAEWLVGRSFGAFGIIIPLILTMIGVRILRRQPLIFHHSVLSSLLVLILGSLTLGVVLDDAGSMFNTGWGGAFGIEMARLLRGHDGSGGAIGLFGSLILLLGGWILTGVFINRNFINTVNRAGSALVDGSGKLVGSVADKVPVIKKMVNAVPVAETSFREEELRPATPGDRRNVSGSAESGGAAPSSDAEASRPADSDSDPAGEESGPSEEDPFIERSIGEAAAGAPKPVVTINDYYGGTKLPDSDSPFVERSLDEKPELTDSEELSDEEVVRPAAEPAEDDAFIEIDLSDSGTIPESHAPSSGAREPSSDDSFGTSAAVAGEALADRPEEVAAGRTEEVDEEIGGVVVTVETRRDRLVDERQIDTEAYDPLKDLIHYRYPDVSLLTDYRSDSEVSDEEIFENKSKIEDTLKNFGIPIQRIKATVGPTVTLYEIVQAQGVKISKIQGLQNDIAQSLKAQGIRIIAPIPGKGTIGIEVPNRDKQIVSMYSAIRSARFQKSDAELPIVIGRTIQNENYVFDLAKMPHLLVAGATGQGKSVGLNAIIASLLYKKHPAQLKFVMIDPKMVEFSLYARIERHFLAKMESEEEAIITDPRKAVYTLNALCTEMENRLTLCKEAGARNIREYNEKFTARRLNPQKGHRFLPYIVVVIDEFADLIMTAREVEAPVMRLAQKARAIGIHLIIATQRPDVRVITGGIKANFPSRIAFRVMQMIDSRTIIDRPGADQLIGRGDMLFSKDGELTRIQCAFADTPDVERIVDYIAHQQGYPSAYALPDYTPESSGDSGGGLGSESSAPAKYDSLFAEIARAAVSQGSISTSAIQRNYEVGFNRAGRIMMQLERAGIVGRQEGAKPRDILFHDLPSLEARLQDLGLF